MLPRIARLKSGLSGRSRGVLVLFGLALLVLPTWYESAYSQFGGRVSDPAARTADSAEKPVLPAVPLVQAPSPPVAKTQRVLTLAAPPSIEFQPQPLEAEEKILEVLNSTTSLEVQDMTLQGLFELLQDQHHLNIIADYRTFEENAIETDARIVDRKFTNISLRSALKIILSDLDLVCYIEDEVLKVTTQNAMSSRRVTRTYPVGDLINSQEDLESLAQAIQEIVTPGEWSEEDASSSQVSKLPNLGGLVVRQHPAGHAEVLDLLRSLRKTKVETVKTVKK